MSILNSPVQIGAMTLKNRVIMAPLTRSRASLGAVPSEIMAAYYAQRASAGLIITEATAVMPSGIGYPNTPGIWNKEQVTAWKNIVNKVHDQGGKIAIQLWHVGRMSDPVFHDGGQPLAPSAIAPAGYVSLLRPKRKFVVPRELTQPGIKEIVQAFAQAAQHAMEAGFDAIELHGANGYLINQFFNPGTNHRTDKYGGSLENRCRFALDIADAVIEVCGAAKVGFHISPNDDEHDLLQQPFPVRLREYQYLVAQLEKREIAFIFSRESVRHSRRVTDTLRNIFSGALIVNEHYNRQQAEEAVAKNLADAVGFGELFISNPDLPKRLFEDLPLTAPITDWYYYTRIENGYTDYTFSK